MKNHLKHRPYLRFVNAPSAETGGDAPTAQETPAAAEDTAQQVDWEAEARKWKELSRKNESRMKENAEKARLYDEAQEQGKSELQKAQEAAAKAEARAAAMEAEAMRAKVAAATGVDADLLSGSSEEELRASAERLLAWRGAQGFGAEIARGLVEAGCFVYVADLNGEGAAAKAAELGGEGVAHPITVNVADEDSVAAMAAEIERVTGGLDLVVSNAGIVRAGSVLEQDASAFRLSTDINYVAFFLVTKHLGQLLARQHSTAPEWLTDIIQINSKSGLVGSNKNAAYAGSKFGGIGLVQSFALEMVAHGVKVNAICPGNFYDGPLWSDPDRGLFVQYLNSGKVPGAKTVADVKEFYEAKVPMRRGAQGIDVLRAIFYIVEQEYETGQAVPVTGGQVMLS